MCVCVCVCGGGGGGGGGGINTDHLLAVRHRFDSIVQGYSLLGAEAFFQKLSFLILKRGKNMIHIALTNALDSVN